MKVNAGLGLMALLLGLGLFVPLQSPLAHHVLGRPG